MICRVKADVGVTFGLVRMKSVMLSQKRTLVVKRFSQSLENRGRVVPDSHMYQIVDTTTFTKQPHYGSWRGRCGKKSCRDRMPCRSFVQG